MFLKNTLVVIVSYMLASIFIGLVNYKEEEEEEKEEETVV